MDLQILREERLFKNEKISLVTMNFVYLKKMKDLFEIEILQTITNPYQYTKKYIN